MIRACVGWPGDDVPAGPVPVCGAGRFGAQALEVPPRHCLTSGCVRGVSWSEVTTVPKRKLHRVLDLNLSLNSEEDIRKVWKENGGTR